MTEQTSLQHSNYAHDPFDAKFENRWKASEKAGSALMALGLFNEPNIVKHDYTSFEIDEILREDSKVLVPPLNSENVQNPWRPDIKSNVVPHASRDSVVSFDELDTNRDGVIDRSEFRAAMSHAKVRR